jgi:capsular exopolysaccharide synthesis family protein
MGKVYDALQRAEEQRARQLGEAGAGPVLRPGLGEIPGAPAAPRPRWWHVLLRRAARREAEDAATLNKRRIAMLQPQSFVTEQFRSLRARLDSLASQQPLRTIAVTSAAPGEGKTTAAVNLALVMSMSVGKRVVLVDCDLRRPRVHHSLGLRVDGGLAEVLRGEVALDQAITPVEGSQLRVLPVRGLPPNPSELLASTRMRELIEKLATDYDHVVLDVPPTLGLPDAKIVTDLCEGILLVVRAHATSQEEVAGALEVLDRSRMLGVVLNEADASPSRYGYAT